MENIIKSSTDVLVKQRSSKNLIYNGCALVISFLIIFVADFLVADAKSSLYMMLVTVGAISVLMFGTRLFFGNKTLVYLPTKSQIKDYTLYFDSADLQNLTYAIETGNMSVMNSTASGKNTGIRLDVAISADDKFAACQIFKYVPYNYEPSSTVYRIADQQLNSFCSGVKQICKTQEK